MINRVGRGEDTRMGKHADRLRELVANDLHRWAGRYLEDRNIDANKKVEAMGVYANAKHLLEVAVDLVTRSEPGEVTP